MSQSVREILDSFDRLPPEERMIAFAEILKRTSGLDHPPLDDETLAQIADETFLKYDAEEAADGHS